MGAPEPAQSSVSTSENDDAALLAALRQGDERAFVTLIDRYHRSLVRLAQLYVADRATAEDVAQETWLGVLRGLERFEGRSSLKTWLFTILTNTAKTRGQRERRSLPFSALAADDGEAEGPAVAPERFVRDGALAGHWISRPQRWDTEPEGRLLRREVRQQLDAAIAALPPNQREVIALRDIEGWSADEVCNALALSETNQRVLLHRARSKVRRALERYVEEA